MTAYELIDSIFQRPQAGLAGNMRRITRAQLSYLRSLIDEDEEGGAIIRGASGSLVWCPRGQDKFVVSEDRVGEKHTLTRLSTLTPSGMERLF